VAAGQEGAVLDDLPSGLLGGLVAERRFAPPSDAAAPVEPGPKIGVTADDQDLPGATIDRLGVIWKADNAS
jgi:hypothetical protein